MPRLNVLDQYSGWLNPAKAAEGIQAALANARSLFADAELLLRNDRWERSAALSILAIEEAGKIPVLRQILLARNEEELKKAWRQYRTHAAKNVAYILPELVTKGARKLSDFAPLYAESSAHPHLLDSVKQIAFYSDACGKCHWSIPTNVITADLARTLFQIAKVFVREGPQAFTTKEELELWVKHMKPVWSGQLAEQKKALLACYAEARAAGVLHADPGKSKLMDFLFGSPKKTLDKRNSIS